MSQISDPQALAESSAVTAQGQAVITHSERESATTHAVSAAAADPSLTSLPGVDKHLDVPASVSSVVTASLAMPIVSSVTGCLASSFAPVGVTSMLSVRESRLVVEPDRESRPVAELERIQAGLGAFSYAVEFDERVDTSSLQEEKASSGGTTSSDDDVELTVRGGNASSDSDDDTIELSPQVTVGDSVVGYTEPSAIATSSYYRDLSVSVPGPSMSVTSRSVEQQRERSQPVRSVFSMTGLPTVAYDRTDSPTSLRCDEEVARISAAAMSPPRPRTSSAPDSPSRCYVNTPVGNHSVIHPRRPLVFGLTLHLMCRREHSHVRRHRCQV